MSTSINSGHGRCARLARWLVGASVVTGVLWLVLRSPHLELHTQLVPAPAPVCDDTSTPPRFAMISLVGPAFLSSWRLALQAKTRYAARHGYQHLVEVPRPGSFAEVGPFCQGRCCVWLTTATCPVEDHVAEAGHHCALLAVL